MSVVPNTRVQKIEFYEVHSAVWRSQVAAVGLTAEETAEMEDRTASARAAYQAALNARDAAKAATNNFYDLVSDMGSFGAGLMSKIRGFAESTQNPNVYTLAQIPPPATPTPAPAPGTPMDFVVTLMQNGAVELKWKCANPAGVSGTLYECRRTIGAGPFVFIGATGVRSFTDDTIPTGSQGVVYEITAVRSTKRGNPAQFNVNFGVGGDGMLFAQVSEHAGAMKMAA